MATLRELALKFSANVAEITSDLSKIERNFQRFQQNIDKIGKAAAASIALIGTGLAFAKMVDGAKSAEAAMAQVTAAIRSTAGAAGVTAKEVANLSNEIKRMTGIDDDLVNSMQSVLLTFTKVGKDVFPQATKAIVDMSVRLGTDLNSAAIMVGKALNDPTRGITALQKAGVSFSETQKALAKQLFETGQIAKSQAIILKELETEFGGAAAAARDTLGGALLALKQNLDDLIDSFAGTRGLREVVEYSNVVLEDMIKTMEALRDPSSKMSKDLDRFSRTLAEGMETAKVWANATIWGLSLVSKGLQQFGVNVSKYFKPAFDAFLLFNPNIATSGKAVSLALGEMGKAFQSADSTFKLALQAGAMPNYFQYFDDAADRARKKIDDLHAAAAKAKPRMVGGIDENIPSEKERKAAEKAAKAKEKLIDSEKKSIESLIQAYRQKNIDLEGQLVKHKEIADQVEAEHKISQLQNVSLKDRLAAIAQLGQLTRERVELERKIEVGKERDKLKEILKNIQDQTEQIKLKNKHQEDQLAIIEAEKSVRDTIKVGLTENLDLQQKITEAAKAQAEAIKEQKHEESLKNLREMSLEYDKQISALQAKLRGEEDLLPLLEQEKKIREDINLSDQEKNEAIASNRNKFGQIKALNDSLEDQKKIIDGVKSSSDDYATKLRKLQEAFSSNQINAKQYEATVTDIWEAQKKSKTVADEFASTLVSGLSKAVTNAKNLKQGLQDAAKQLALFAAQHLLLKPLENAIANLGNWLTGSGKYLQKPGTPSAPASNSFAGLPALFGGAANSPTGSGGGGFLSSIAKFFRLPTFALGGSAFAGQAALFGENGMELAIPKQDMHVFTAAQTKQILGPSSSAQAWQNNLNWSAGMTTGDWMAKNERAWQLSQERNYLNSSLAPALNQAWRDDTIMKAQSMTAEMMRAGKTDHIGFDILNRVQNGGSMMMAMAPNFQLPTGDQQFSILSQMASRGVNISPALLQMAMDNDYLFRGGSSGMYASGSLGGFLNNPLGYKSMGIEGKTPWKTYQDIDSMESLAYGGDGSAVVSELMRAAKRDASWNANSVGSYLRSMMNTQPLGGYRGASEEYLRNIKGWNKFSKNHKPYADAYGFGVWSGPTTDGMSISNGGWVDSRGGGSSNDWIDDEYFTGAANPKRFDPTVASKEYQPKPGTAQDFLKSLNKNPYFDFAANTMGGIKEAFKKLFGGKANNGFSGVGQVGDWIDLPGAKQGRNFKQDALDAFNSWVLSGKGQGLKIGGVTKDMLDSMQSWQYKGKGLKIGDLAGDLNEAFRSWLPTPTRYGIKLPRSLEDPFSSVGSYPAYPAAFGIATMDDVFSQQLFKNPPPGRPSSSFDRWPTSPIYAGRIDAKMKGYANGGLLRAGEMAVVGEKGKEFIMSPNDVQVVPANQPGGARPEVNVNVIEVPGYKAQVNKLADGTIEVRHIAKMIGSQLEEMGFLNTGVAQRRPIR
ncbi:MAG: hypothetical protein LCH63_10325 [Candidatus Melainabacteria bacterium]|nr:hypothetical protein [Candidatus Melainabacteria bacterium]